MILVIALAAVAAAAVYAYSRWQAEQPALAAESTRRAHQLASVALVLARAVEGVAEAMSLSRSHPLPARGTRLIDLFDDEEGYR